MRDLRLQALFAVLLLALVTVAPLPAQAPAPEREAATAGKHLLWRITGPHGKTAYLMGSIHVGRDDLFPLPEAYDRAFEEAAFVAFEIDPDKILSASVAVVRRGFFWDERTLEEELSPATWQRLRKFARSTDLDLDSLRRAKPWLVALTLSMTTVENTGYTAAAGIDQSLSNRARAVEKPRRFLETADEQLSFFDGFSAEEQETLLLSALDEAEVGQEELDELTEAWVQGDVEALDRLVKESAENMPSFVDRLLIQRNRNWVPRIQGWLTEGEPFLVIVGAAHLVGEGSVVDLLREKGYRVDRL